MAKRSFYVKDSELDDYQVKVINKKTDNSYIVKGCAGSGKSILALWKAKQIQDEHKGTYLYIVFTKALMQYMADGISQVGIPQRNVDYHWHWQNRAGCPSADYIIVDEAQDFSKEDIELFRSKAKKHYCCMVIRLNNFILLLKISKLFQWRIYSILLSSLSNSLCSIIDYPKR